MSRVKALNVLVGPMLPLVAGGRYDRTFHTYEVLRPAGLGASYDDPRRVVLVPMRYDPEPKPKRARRRP